MKLKEVLKLAPFLFLNMIRQNIILGNYRYIVDLYKANSDLKNSKHYESFVVLKTNEMINNVMHDRDILFIKKSIIDKCLEDHSLIEKMIAFPITNDSITMSYSSDYKAFNKSYNEDTFFNESDEFGDILYMFKNNNLTQVLCDKIRIWLPITNSKLDSILHISNIINDITFHYICENIDNYERNANGELKIGNDIYSEYIDIWIPNIENLFAPSTHYIKENYNFTKLKQKITYKDNDEDYLTIYPCVYFEGDDYNVTKKLSIEAFRTYNLNENYNLKLKIDDNVFDLNWNMMSLNETTVMNSNSKYSILLMNGVDQIHEYKIYDEEIKYDNSSKSLWCSTFLMILPFFIDEQELFQTSYVSKTYFNVEKNLLDNILANPLVISLSPFSGINKTTNTYESVDLNENSDIVTLSKDIKMAISFEFNTETDGDDLNNYGVYMLNCKFNYHPLNNETIQEFYLDKVKLSHYDYLSNNIVDNGEYDDDIFNPKIDKCGFIIEMATDSTFKTLVYEYVMNMNIVDSSSMIIDDTKFKLNFDKSLVWNAYPETLVVRVKYVDRVSYTIIASNPLFITKDNFKYIINDNNSRLMLIDSKQGAEQLSRREYDKIYADQTMNLSYFNFIDKISCTVISKDSESQNNVANSKTSQKVIFKPVFYKVKDLQQIKLKNGITQNIGLNLSDILSKADTFKVVIENNEFPEVARNDAYVIFKVNAQEIKATSGQYNLLDQDDQFVSDGTWYIY